jgi:hypothetical protein
MAKDIFEVQTRFIGHWENCWTEEGNDGTERPQVFETRDEAEDAINEFFADLGRAGMANSYCRNDYRVVQITEQDALSHQ